MTISFSTKPAPGRSTPTARSPVPRGGRRRRAAGGMLGGLAVALLLGGIAASPGTPAAAPKLDIPMPDARDMSRAKAILQAMDERKWFIVGSSIKAIQAPALRKLLNWQLYRHGTAEVDFAEVSAFFLENPDWPLLPEVRRRIERDAGSAPDEAVAAWFERYPPITADGCGTYVSALKRRSAEAAREAAERCWIILPMSRQEASAFAGMHGGLIGEAAHIDRLRHAVRSNRTEAAEALLRSGRVPDTEAKLIELRLKMREADARKNQSTILSALRSVPDKARDDPDFLYDELRWQRRRGAPAEARKLLDKAPDRPVFARRWWVERSILVHELMAAGNWKDAYRLVSEHRQWGSGQPNEPEALAGWIALRHLEDPMRAALHFQRVWFTAPDRRDRAAAAYWLGRTAAAAGDKKLAAKWYRVAAAEGATFYGQLAQMRTKGPVDGSLTPPPIPDKVAKAFAARPLVRATRLIEPLGMTDTVRPFLVRLASTSRTNEDLRLVAALAKEIGETNASVRLARLALRKGPAEPDLAFPRPEMPADLAVDPALVLAVIRQESEFNAAARSPAGARGLMQLMPGTAKQMARRLKIPFEGEKLTDDPSYNVKLGAAYLEHLLQKYRASIPLAVAAYNAGPSRIDDWVKRHGHPANERTDALDWIVRVPYGETRDYVQKVLSNYLVYRALLGKPADKGGAEANWTADRGGK